MSDISELIPERVRASKLYDPNRKPVTHDLSDNTSQWGMAPGVLEAFQALTDNTVSLSRYPNIYGKPLKEALVKRYKEFLTEGIDQIVIGCGTDDVLDCTVRACTEAGDLIVTPTPSFAMPLYFGRDNGRRVEEVTLGRDGSLPIDEIVEKDPKLLYLCSPNNPTGLSLVRSEIDEVVQRTNGFVIIDEAYAEFADTNCLDLLSNPRVIILRTFSKLHALAGLRIGYGLGNPEVINALHALRGPYKANAPALAAAQASLGQKEWLDQVVVEIRETRAWFIEQLTSLGLSPLSSDANFVFVPMDVPSTLKDDLDAASIGIRIFENLNVYGTGIRVTVAPRDVLQKFLDVLSRNLSQEVSLER